MLTKTVQTVVGSLLCASLWACGGDTTDPGTTMDTTPGDANVLAGTFQVNLIAPDSATGASGYTSVVGKVADGPAPSQLLWTQASSDGACKLMKPRVPFCNTPCGGSAVCVADDTCQAYPSAKSVGTVTVAGVKTTAGATEFKMEPIAGNYQPPAGVSCPFPAFSEGGQIQLSAAGGVYAPFTLKAAGITPLQLLSTQIPVNANQAVSLSWTPGQAQVGAKIHVKLDISHHGGTKGMIECDADDTGSLQIGAGLVTDLLNLGTAGYPTIVVTRSAPTGTAVIAPGRVELLVSSTVEHAVQVAGVVSCSDSSQCPAGKTCQADLTCK